MRIAGVRLENSRVVWVDAGDLDIDPLDDVVVAVDGGESRGMVIVAPDALLRPTEAEGWVVHVAPGRPDEDDCGDLPGADMPPLGSQRDGGMVVSIDAVKRQVMVEMPDGERKARSTGSGGSD